MDPDYIKIRIEIAEKPYSLTILRQEEEIVRRAAKRIKERIEELKRKYEASLVDYLAMVAFGISLDNENNIEKLSLSAESRKIDELASELEEYIDQQKTDK